MLKLNPENLRTLREARNWSYSRLADEARIDKQTVYRLEKGKSAKTRARTIEQIAAALKTSVEALCGPSFTAADPVPTAELSRRSQLNVKVSDFARNALALVARRYGVKPTTVVEAAPLMFLCLAEQSLLARAERLHQFRSMLDAAESKESAPSHLWMSSVINHEAYQALDQEERSILARDIFAKGVRPDADYLDDYELYHGVSGDNPFARFISEIAQRVDGATFDGWYPEWGASYTLGLEEAASLVGGDAEAAEHIVEGRVALHELPKELRRASEVEARTDWVKEKAAEWAAAHPPLDIADLFPASTSLHSHAEGGNSQ